MCYNNTNNYSSFENFINSLDNHNELKNIFIAIVLLLQILKKMFL